GEPAARSLSPQHAGAAARRIQCCFPSSNLRQHMRGPEASPRPNGCVSPIPLSDADSELLDGDDAEGCGDDPACGARNPWPTILVGIEANVAIRGFEFPPPETSAPLGLAQHTAIERLFR